MGVPLGTFRAKWAQIRFARYEPGWSQSANAYAGTVLHCALAMARAEASVVDKKTFGPAFKTAFQATEDFAGHWGGRLSRSKAEEFGHDVSDLSEVIMEGAKKVVALPSEAPPRPDIG
jgi:hypothetical protein